MTKADKRRLKNRQNLVKFFSGKDRHERPRLPALEKFDPQVFVDMCQLYLAHAGQLDVGNRNDWKREQIFAYVRRFRQAASEIDASDVTEALNELHVRGVMES